MDVITIESLMMSGLAIAGAVIGVLWRDRENRIKQLEADSIKCKEDRHKLFDEVGKLKVENAELRSEVEHLTELTESSDRRHYDGRDSGSH